MTFDLNIRKQFLCVALVFEGGLALLAFALGFATGVNPIHWLVWNWRAALWGVAGALPLFAFFVLAYVAPLRALQEIKRFLLEVLGPALAACRWYDLILLALFAGIGEELLFRGWLQVWMENWGGSVALIGSNIVFGLAHFITPLYAVVAGFLGLYLGVLFDATGERNLLVPIVTHALYDYLGFLVVVRTWRRTHRTPPPAEGTAEAGASA